MVEEQIMIDVIEVLYAIEKSDEFKTWNQEHPENFLAHLFRSLDNQGNGEWQVGYYLPKTQKMTTFIPATPEKKVDVARDLEVLKPQGLLPLDKETIHIDSTTALTAAAKKRAENYGTEPILKTFFLVQNSSNGTIFNITYFTQSFKTINMHISASDASVLEHSKNDLAAFG